MVKQDARAVFNRLQEKDPNSKFEQILAGINIFKYVRNTKKPIIEFIPEQLDILLRDHTGNLIFVLNVCSIFLFTIREHEHK